MRYILAKIDLMDTFILADVFDEDKYKQIEESDNIESILDKTIEGFRNDNKEFKDYDDWTDRAEDMGWEYGILKNHSTIFRGSSTLMGPKVVNAFNLARKYHAGQTRKGDGYPYLEHPLEVAWLLYRGKFNPDFDIVAAAFAHDLLEDTVCSEQEILDGCGSEVLRIVKAVSNDPALEDLKDWEKKKLKYIESVRVGGEKAIVVSIADKICNLLSMFDAYEKEGPAIWSRFNRGKDQKLWFEKEVLKMVKEAGWENPLSHIYEKLIKELEELE